MVMRPTREWNELITPDGVTYLLHVPSRLGKWVISQSGWGTPPIEYVTQRGPFQDGETVKDFFLRPRIVQLFIRQEFCNRLDYWTGRAGLLDHIRPNRQLLPTATEPYQLRRILRDGSRRDLNVFIAEGPRFEPAVVARWDEFAFQEMLRFIAHDPIIFDPDEEEVLFALASSDELVFPITFPIVFGASVIDDTQNITYTGTWSSFPIIVITGPVNDLVIGNTATGEELTWTADIAAGRTVTVDLTTGNKTVTDDLGANLLGTIDPASDLGTFHIAPDPEAAGGVNPITVEGYGATGATSVTLSYFTRYYGI